MNRRSDKLALRPATITEQAAWRPPSVWRGSFRRRTGRRPPTPTILGLTITSSN